MTDLAPQVRSSAAALRLRLHQQRRRHDLGGVASSGPGSSLEFHDYRAYQPGDDLRHLDWGVLGRSDQLVIRRHRQEVAPRCAILLDASASMGVDAGKWELARDLAALMVQVALNAGARPQLLVATERWREIPITTWIPQLMSLIPSGTAGLEASAPPLQAGGERILISDGLCPGGALSVVRALARQAATCVMLEILSPDELQPTPRGSVELVDVEGPRQELLLDAAACAAYGRRLAAHRHSWRSALAGRGPGVVALASAAGWHAAVRALLRNGLLEAQR